MLSKSFRSFVRNHLHDDLNELILKGSNSVDLKAAAEQIISRRKLIEKFPEWSENYELVMPPPVSVEQSSSMATAAYKTRIISPGKQFIDLTCGFGVDCFLLAPLFHSVIGVEEDPKLAKLVAYNFQQLDADISIINQNATDFIHAFQGKADLVYVDPARRQNDNKVFLLEDCSPNILELIPELLRMSNQVLLKLSPLLDIRKTIAALGGASEIHVVSRKNECKEVLVFITSNRCMDPPITCVNLESSDPEFRFSFQDEVDLDLNYGLPQINHYLYEPNASILKAGAFQSVAQVFQLNKLHKHTHLYSSPHFVEKFPGRKFLIRNIIKVQKRELHEIIKNGRANLTLRNFPGDTGNLRQKLQLKEGGSHYVFACTLAHDQRALIIGDKTIKA
jgi:hypothetical protein